MSTYSDKILKGEAPTDEDWAQHLIEAHREAPTMTPDGFLPFLTRDGLTSYATLANCLPPSPRCVIDLACGDGILTSEILPRLAPDGRMIGIDMADEGLNLARRRYPDPRAEFVCARADNMPVDSEGADAILCHMAFMLMLPLDPVVREIERVLKPGGAFHALIPTPRDSQTGYFGEIRKVIGEFFESRYPGFRNARSGDPRVRDREGVQSLFAARGAFAPIESLTPCPVFVQTDGEGVWEFMAGTYFIAMLPEADKADLRNVLTAFVGPKTAEFEFPMQIFSARKL